MVSRNELLEWVSRLNEDDMIGIDEGGLCLTGSIGFDPASPEAPSGTADWFEIGGMPLAEDFDYIRQEYIDHEES